MSIFHGGETERFVLAGVLIVADADESSFEQLDHRRQNFFARQTGQLQILRHAPPDFRQRFGEIDNAIVFVFVANFTPTFVIEILFAAARVAPGRLNVAIRRRTNPNVGPRRRNREPLQSQKSLLVANLLAIDVEPIKAFAVCFARVTGAIIADIAQTGPFGSVHRFRDEVRAVAMSVFRLCVHLINSPAEDASAVNDLRRLRERVCSTHEP